MAIILIVEEDGNREVYELTSVLIAGRNSKCKIILQNDQASGEHCKFSKLPSGQTQVIDLGSTNGICLNNSSIKQSKIYLGDKVNIGSATAWLDPKKMNQVEREVHTKEGLGRKSPAVTPEIELPIAVRKSEKSAKGAKGAGLLGPGKPKEKEDRTSTAVKNVRKARQTINKK